MASDGGGGASEGRGFRGCATDVDVDRYTDVSSLGIRAAGLDRYPDTRGIRGEGRCDR